MATREIDENEYAELKRVHDAAMIIGQDPQRRARLQELLAEAAPDKVGDVPLLRREVREAVSGIEKKFDDFIAEQRKQRDDREAEDAKRVLESRWLDGKKQLRDAGYNDDGIAKIEEIMEKRGIADHEAAMALFERENPPPEPVMTGGSRWNFFEAPKEDVNFKALMEGQDEAFLGSAVGAALKEVRGR